MMEELEIYYNHYKEPLKVSDKYLCGGDIKLAMCHECQGIFVLGAETRQDYQGNFLCKRCI